ncbi:MAG: thioesterase family protein [Nocardioides sp.]|uniref:acyl-CoA thioesterase n=1 Tax=Nocardioides sp. TaxID=35761 RepID=UPI0039E494DF
MRHVYECPMRWADLDLLGHVNNVVYADYLQEARVDMLRVHARSQTQGLAEGVVVVSHQLTYLRPLHFDFAPVYVETWVTEIRAASFTLGYEVYRDRDGERTVYLRAITVLSPYVFDAERPRRLTQDERAHLAPYLEPAPTPRLTFAESNRIDLGRFPLTVRFSDVDAYGHVNNVKYFEYLQEGRMVMSHDIAARCGIDQPSVVVAQSDIAYRLPILSRPEPYVLWSWVSRLGTTSMTVEAEIVDPEAEDRVLAHGRTVVVFFDTETGRAVPPDPAFRQAIAELR